MAELVEHWYGILLVISWGHEFNPCMLHFFWYDIITTEYLANEFSFLCPEVESNWTPGGLQMDSRQKIGWATTKEKMSKLQMEYVGECKVLHLNNNLVISRELVPHKVYIFGHHNNHYWSWHTKMAKVTSMWPSPIFENECYTRKKLRKHLSHPYVIDY